jgi:hypothetical protein
MSKLNRRDARKARKLPRELDALAFLVDALLTPYEDLVTEWAMREVIARSEGAAGYHAPSLENQDQLHDMIAAGRTFTRSLAEVAETQRAIYAKRQSE